MLSPLHINEIIFMPEITSIQKMMTNGQPLVVKKQSAVKAVESLRQEQRLHYTLY